MMSAACMPAPRSRTALLWQPGETVYVGAAVFGTEDLDPGPAMDLRTSTANGTGALMDNAFITKFVP
jgi:hypothetical protein